MTGFERDGRLASNQHQNAHLLFSSSSGEESEEDEEDEEDGGPTEEEWCAKMETFQISSRPPPSLGSLRNSQKLAATHDDCNDSLLLPTQQQKLLLPGQSESQSSALSRAASNAAPAAHRPNPLLRQQGTSSHSNSLQPLFSTRLLPPLLPTFAAGPKADSDHGHPQRLDSRLHRFERLTDTRATLMSSLGTSFQKVISIVTFPSKYTRALTFENFFQALHSVT
jgi:hypothetical protein